MSSLWDLLQWNLSTGAAVIVKNKTKGRGEPHTWKNSPKLAFYRCEEVCPAETGITYRSNNFHSCASGVNFWFLFQAARSFLNSLSCWWHIRGMSGGPWLLAFPNISWTPRLSWGEIAGWFQLSWGNVEVIQAAFLCSRCSLWQGHC